MSERYAFIEAEKANHKVARLGHVMKVSRSGFYAEERVGSVHWRRGPPRFAGPLLSRRAVYV